MKRLAIFMMTLLVLTSIVAQAETLHAVGATGNIPVLPKGTKVMFSGAGDAAVLAAGERELKENGYVIVEYRNKPEYLFLVEKLELTITNDDGTQTVNYADIGRDEFKNAIVPAAIKQSDLANATSEQQEKIAKGRVRSVLDMDAGVISQGIRLTGSNSGGLVVGIIGALIGKAADTIASRSDSPPPGAVKLVGVIHRNGMRDIRKVVISLASTKDEKPQTLFNEAIKVYVSLVVNGYNVPAKPTEKQNATEQQAKANL